MNVLLDTHVALWWLDDHPKLLPKYREIITDTNNLIYVSAATVWEINIKAGLGKLVISDTYLDVLRREGFLELDVNWSHAQRVGELPAIHSDPFDRLLIAQAQIEKLTFLSVDKFVRKYDLQVL